MAIKVLQNRRIVLGVTGSIAAYKAATLASQLTQAGAIVDVVFSEAAERFISPLTFRSLTHRPVVTDLFDPQSEIAADHVYLAKQADLLVVAPATANTIAKLSWGLADNALLCTALATTAPIIIAPAMESQMYAHPATTENLARLKARGYVVVEPGVGRLASGLEGPGRLAEPAELIETIRLVLGRSGDLAGRRLVITAGGTAEPIDPVRVLTNRSSGKMGYALAEVARDRGAIVTLISAPTALAVPLGVEFIGAETATDMRDAVSLASHDADVLIMAAAVADYRVAEPSPQKIKKSESGEELTLQLVRTPDILGEVGGPLLKVGFAAESEQLIAHASEKLKTKGLDLVVANDITAPGAGFGSDTNKVVILHRRGEYEELPLLPKREVAEQILDRVTNLLRERSST